MNQAKRKAPIAKEMGARDERGFITLDFMLAIVIAFGFSAVFFALSVTLSMVEVTQYVAFATSRAYLAAHESVSQQKQTGENKFTELMSHRALKFLLNKDWFEVGSPIIGEFNSEYRDHQPAATDSETFEGARIPIVARLLNLRVPFLGPTVTKTGTGKAKVSSYLGREVSTTECRDNFTDKRFEMLRAATFGGATPYASPATNSANEYMITDNGC